MLITPAHAHIHVQSDCKAGIGPKSTPGFVGIHGVVTGTHGAGVGVPRAAAVAAITAGLVGALHIPKVGIFITGTKSIIVPIGNIQAKIGILGKIMSFVGAIPKEHLQSAPQTAIGIYASFQPVPTIDIKFV